MNIWNFPNIYVLNKMNKILFNCTTNIKGGTVQNSANFIISTLNNDTSNQYFYLVSSAVYKIIEKYNIPNDKLIVYSVSPSKSILSRFKIKRCANKINPDIIFTMAGPAYINFNQLHFMGCSNPYILFASAKDIFFGRNIVSFIARYIHTQYQKFYIRKADYFLFQTEKTKRDFMKKIGHDKAFVIPNAVGFNFEEVSIKKSRIYSSGNDVLHVLCPFEKYPHKGFHIIPVLLHYLERRNFKIHFIVTISDCNGISDSQIDLFNIQNTGISYIGQQKYFDMPDLYINSDIVFMPSVLEVFSSVCTESLYFKKPLVTSDNEFNSDIVEKYAFYCDPYSIESCASAIINASKNVNSDSYLSEGQRHIITKFGEYNDRYGAIVKSMNTILK